MNISEALNLLFEIAEKHRGTRAQHQRIYEAQETIINYLKPKTDDATPQDTREEQQPNV